MKPMIVSNSTDSLLNGLKAVPQPVVFVPTMGALHAGHVALIRLAREKAGSAGTVAVSIFVNPIQFDRAADLANYPKPLDGDLAKCRNAGVDIVFHPEATAMYRPDRSVTVTETSLSKHLCGAARPGHFDGVCTVVLKLFNLIRPAAAIFGNKDFQQLAIIRRMVRDLDLQVEIIGHPTVRETDGLAMSSRNALLTPEHRADAPMIQRSLEAAAALLRYGERSVEPILAAARFHLSASPSFRIDYLTIVDAETLEPVGRITNRSVLAVAGFYDGVRLIDNIILTP